MMAGLMVAGRLSRAGTRRWPGITASTPASIAARNGTSSRAASTCSGGVEPGKLDVRVDGRRRRGPGSA